MTHEEKLAAINEKAARKNDLKRALESTDYVVVRAIEQNMEISPEFKTRRQGWRDEINDLEQEIAELQETDPDEMEV